MSDDQRQDIEDELRQELADEARGRAIDGREVEPVTIERVKQQREAIFERSLAL